MAKKKAAPAGPSFDEVVERMYRDGDQYQRDVAAVAERLGPGSPEFTAWCREMDAWRQA